MKRIGIIGCGLVGDMHASLLTELGASVSLTHDAQPERAHATGKRVGAAAAASPEDIINDDAIDAVYICTHHDSHAKLTILAANRGKAIFLEKPMALTEPDLDSIREAIERTGVTLMAGFKMRYYPLVRMARACTEKPILLTGQILDARWPDDSWANDPAKGGGNVLAQGCHAFDLLTYLARARPVRVYAESGNLHHPGLAIQDAMTATLAFDSGAIASVTVADTGAPGRVGKLAFYLSDGDRSAHLYNRLCALDIAEPGETTEHRVDEESGFFEEDREFLSALTEGRKPETDHVDGYRASMIVVRAIESARERRPISLEDLP